MLIQKIKADGEAVTIHLATSKSISNRYLVLDALRKNVLNLLSIEVPSTELHNCSDAADTVFLQTLLSSANDVENDVENDILGCGAGGTTFRFLLAYKALTTKKTVVITGSERLRERPIAPLVAALRELGADISYLGTPNYAPLRVAPSTLSATKTIDIDVTKSSQFLTALLLIGGFVEGGLRLRLVGEAVSGAYTKLTLAALRAYGISYEYDNKDTIIVAQADTKNLVANTKSLTVPADWSGASYIFLAAALGAKRTIYLPNLDITDGQPDAAIVDIAAQFGVQTTVLANGIAIEKIGDKQPDFLEYDFTNCPDIAQTVAVLCAARGVRARLTGLSTLRIKETDRIFALQKELAKLNVTATINGDDALAISGKVHFNNQIISIATYEDHRMAMSFAPLALIFDSGIIIEDIDVVKKSFPSFWRELEKLGGKVIRV